MTGNPLVGRLLGGLLVAVLLGGAAAAPAQAVDPVRAPLTARDKKTGPVSPDLVVKVDVAGGRTIAEVATRYGLEVKSALLASRGIYLVTATRPGDIANTKTLAGLVKKLEHDRAVVYAEPNVATQLDDNRMHAWLAGSPGASTDEGAAYLDQPAAAGLSTAHALSTGQGVTVAVLDTGVDADHPALTGKVFGGWDYVDDDSDPSDQRADPSSSLPDEAYGHGTFVAGLVALVAPQAQIMPERVLDGDGNGNVFVVAQAILDAVAAGADIVNLSCGTVGNVASALLDEALKTARDKGAVVVASAGNQGSSTPLYPADSKHALSVSALDLSTGEVAGWASWGAWVAVAAPGTDVVGPVPDGSYAVWSGTSMAAPQVSGQLALIRARSPKLSPDAQTKAVESTAQPVSGKAVRYGAVDVSESVQKTAKKEKKEKKLTTEAVSPR